MTSPEPYSISLLNSLYFKATPEGPGKEMVGNLSALDPRHVAVLLPA